MKRIGRRSTALLLLVVFFFGCTGWFLFKYVNNAGIWAVHPANPDAYQNGGLINRGTVISSDGQSLYADGNYADDKKTRIATLHAVGDLTGSIATGVLRRYKVQLAGHDIFNGIYSPQKKGGEVTLTINAELCVSAYDALGKYNGTVGIYNYKTGEILCMVSKPAFDPRDIPDITKSEYNGVYVNNLFNGLYVPGSVMKLITTAAALETMVDIDTREFECKGGVEIDGQWVACNAKHGKINFEQALTKSCNAAFALIANEVGADTLSKYAKAAGLTSSYNAGGISSAAGSFDLTGASAADIAWAGIGQYTTMVNPMCFMMLMSAIANEGNAVLPYYVESIKTYYGMSQSFRIPKQQTRMLDKYAAARLRVFMRANVLNGYGEKGFEGMELCAKTGTAEVGGGKAPHSWFVGFSDNPDTPLAFVVVAENGSTGTATAINITKKLLPQAVKLFEPVVD